MGNFRDVSRTPQEWSASVPGRDRYTPPKQERTVSVSLDGETWPGTVLGVNGPRVQVRVVTDRGTFVRWVDAADVADAEPQPESGTSARDDDVDGAPAVS